MDRISNGLRLTQMSFRVLSLDKELLIFPLLSGVCCLLVTASFLLPLLGTEWFQQVLAGEEVAARESTQPSPLLYVLTFLYYLVNYFVIFFFNSALVACAVIRFRGGDPTVSDGFRAAWARLPQILGWALVSATVGMILKLVESRSGWVGKLVTGLVGAAWSIATYFVVPVLVVEKLGPIEAIQRSLGVLRRNWGESLAANFGMGILLFVGGLLLVMPQFLLGMWAVSSEQMVLAGILFTSAVLTGILLSLVSTALDAILVTALYLYATEERVPAYFDDRLLRGAFVTR